MLASLKRFDVRVSVGYFVAAMVWILLSDNTLGLLFSSNPPLLLVLSSLKGGMFVTLTTVALFIVLRTKARKRDRVEQALQHSEKRFRTVFHGGPVATSISQVKMGYIVDVKDAFLEMFGYTREELIGHTSVELGLSTNLERSPAAVNAVAEAGGIRDFELQGRAKSGEIIYLLASIRVIDLENEPHFVSMFYDVTDQRKLQEQVRYQALLLENVSDAVVSTDVDFNIRSWNPAAEAIFGWKAEEVIGKSVKELFQPEYLNSTRENVLNQVQTLGVWRGETTYRRKDGSRVHLSASMSYICDKDDHGIGIVSVNRDITEVVKVEKEKQEAAQLRLEIQKQTELVRLKENFISIVSHEFRTPLTVIMSSSELLRTHYGRMPAERQLKHFQIILEQTKYMAVLIDDVLTINKARAGKLDFNPAPLDLVAFSRYVAIPRRSGQR
jgi:PAS domain S-box-containing protein